VLAYAFSLINTSQSSSQKESVHRRGKSDLCWLRFHIARRAKTKMLIK